MMKVVTVLGSPRPEGNTATVLSWVEDALRQMGHEVERIDVNKFTVTGCVECQRCQFEPDIERLHARLEHLRKMRGLSRLMVSHALVLMKDAKPDDAIKACVESACVGRAIAEEPFLVSQLVRIAVGSIGWMGLETVLSQAKGSEATYRYAIVTLDGLEFHDAAVTGLKLGRAMMMDFLDKLRRDPKSVKAQIDALIPAVFLWSSSPDKEAREKRRRRMGLRFATTRKGIAAEVDCLRYLADVISFCKDPTRCFSGRYAALQKIDMELFDVQFVKIKLMFIQLK